MVENNLIHETSPYLLQHAENPVNWYGWNDEALQKAKDENKPIFLSVGYSACHWCHVMAHESFENNDYPPHEKLYLLRENNDGKIDIEEQKKLNEFLEKIGGIGGKDDEEYNGDGEEGEGKGTGEGKGFGDGLDSVGNHNSIDPATLDCEQGKGTGGLTIKIIRSPYGKIVEFDQTSFKSTLTGFTFSSDQQKEKLLNCIKKEYNEAIDKGEKVKIYEKDHLHTLKLDFIN